MRHTISTHISRFFRFMRLFGIAMFSIVRVESDYIYAIIAWEEDCQNGIPDAEDVQKVRWVCEPDSKIDDALTVGEYAYDAGWIFSDRLAINKNELIESLGWNRERTAMAVDKLMQIKVFMIDDGKETDSFFLHG